MQLHESSLHAMASRLFGDHTTPAALGAAEAGVWPAAAWAAVEAAGLHLALMPESAGGFGVPASEALGILRAAGETALPLPLAETMIAVRLLTSAGLDVPDGPLSIAPVVDQPLALLREGKGWRLRGRMAHVPWGRNAAALAVSAVAEDTHWIASMPAGSCMIGHETNIAGEPRDTLTVDTKLDSVAPLPISPAGLRALGAAMRCQQIAGAIGAVCDMSVRYAQDRVQFGRAIGRFQAVQQSLAVLAGQAAASAAAADLAADAIDPDIRPLAIAAAKIRAGEAAGLAASIAHQLHGAMGFTHEHKLHYLTRRLWSWRDEFGNETAWSRSLGRHLTGAGPDRLWAELTALA